MCLRARRLPQLLALLLVGACSVGAQSKDPADLAKGKLLVAPRNSSDPVFAKSVILLVRYGHSGALGLMLNHRTKLPISQALSGLKGAAGHSDPVFIGGPVQLDSVFALARAKGREPKSASKVFGNIYLIMAKSALEQALGKPAGPSQLRIYVGYCGWAPHQLETEVTEGRWYIFSGSAAFAFDANPGTLWARLISRTKERYARLGFAPLLRLESFPFPQTAGNYRKQLPVRLRQF